VQIFGVADTSATIAQVTDVKTSSVNDLLTPGRNLRISGAKLKIAGNNPANGVWFVSQDAQARTKVESDEIVTNNPSELIIVIPALAAETYRVEVTTQYSTGGSMLKEPKSAMFDRTYYRFNTDLVEIEDEYGKKKTEMVLSGEIPDWHTEAAKNKKTV